MILARRLVTLLGSLTVVFWLFAAAGCAWPNLRGEGFSDETTGWTKKLRQPTAKGNLAGVDERSREIERNLGVR
jgi:hypothetical protein